MKYFLRLMKADSLYCTAIKRQGNTPVNVIVGALIIKELFDYSDDEMVENLMLDFRIQYALHTTSFEEQPLSDKILTGKEAPDIFADFEFNAEGTKVLRCPAGHEPKSCSFMKQSNQCAVSFLHEQCAGCPCQNQCRPKIRCWCKMNHEIICSYLKKSAVLLQKYEFFNVL